MAVLENVAQQMQSAPQVKVTRGPSGPVCARLVWKWIDRSVWPLNVTLPHCVAPVAWQANRSSMSLCSRLWLAISCHQPKFSPGSKVKCGTNDDTASSGTWSGVVEDGSSLRNDSISRSHAS